MLSTMDFVELEVLRMMSAPPAAARFFPSRTISSAPSRRPPLENSVLFHGMNGFLDREQFGKEGDLSASAMPRFWSRSGEQREIPPAFAAAVRGATTGATCVGCSHTHCLVAPLAVGISSGSV